MTDVLVDGTTDGAVLTDPQITVVLETLAANAGNRDKTIEQLGEAGIDLSPGTLRHWSGRKYADRYKLARAQRAEKLKETLADQHHDAAGTALDVEREAMEKIREKIPDMDGKELAAVAGKAGVNSGIHTDKGQLLSGEATQRVERTPDEIARALKKHGAKISFDFDGDAEEEDTPALPPAPTD